MYSLLGIIGLIFFAYIRPQEFIPSLGAVPWINMWLVLMMGGFYLDYSSGRIRKEKTPLLYWSLFFYGWCYFTLAVKQAGELGARFPYLTTGIGLALIMQHSMQSMKIFVRLATVIFVISMFCVGVAFHQGFQDFQCILVKPNEEPDMPKLLIPDGRGCEKPRECEEGDGAEEGGDYWCEHVGILGTTSISGGRVRWRGVLNDPNEISLAAGTSIPFALAFFESKRTIFRLLLVLATVVVVAIVDVFSQSRGAILIFLVVMGIYFVRKYGIRGALIGGGMGAPLLMLGGRSGAEADQSAEERMEVMSDGLNMFVANPVMGVGYGQFTKFTFLTAHNAYVLASAELGLIGFGAWMVIIFTVMKTMVIAYKRYANVPGGEQVRAWALALFASFSGTLLGIFFLSWTYHYVLWIYFGVAGGLYTAIRARDPYFTVSLKRSEIGAVYAFAFMFMIALKFYLRLKGH